MVTDVAVVVAEAVAMVEAVVEAVTVEVVAEEVDPEDHQEEDNEIELLITAWVKELTKFSSADNIWTSFWLSTDKFVREFSINSYKFLNLFS